MSAKRQSVLRGCGRTIVLVLLTPITTLNASQALTLCVGYDGHMALEMLVQDRCTCEIRSSEADPQRDAIAGSARVMDGSNLPCLDIPIPGSSCDDRMRAHPSPRDGRQRPAPISFAGLTNHSLSFVNSITVADDTTQSSLPTIRYCTPLDSILLQV